jgi:hypothetical protein
MTRLVHKRPKHQIGELVCSTRNPRRIGIIEEVRATFPNEPLHDRILVGWEKGPSSWYSGQELWEPASVISIEMSKLNELIAAHNRASRRLPKP